MQPRLRPRFRILEISSPHIFSAPFGVIDDYARSDSSMDRRANRCSLVDLWHENFTPEHVRHQLH